MAATASTTTSSADAAQLPLPWMANLFFSLLSFLAHAVIMVAHPSRGPLCFLRRLCNTNLLFFYASSPISSSSLVDPDAVKGDGWAEAPKAVPSRPQLTWKTRLFVSLVSLIADAVRRPDGTVRRYLSRFDLTVAPNPEPVRGVRTADVTVDPDRGLWFRLFLPDAAGSGGTSTKLPVVVFFHGGGFAFLSPSSLAYDAACRRICRNTGAAIVSVNYRLSPEHRCPAPYVDGLDVLRFLHTGARPCGGDQLLVRRFFEVADLSSCFLAGDSAGGNIAHHVARRWIAAGESPARGGVALAGLVAIQPYFGGEGRVESEIRLSGVPLVNTERTDWFWKAFLPEGADRDHEAANPEASVEGLEEGFPPAMVVVGGFDPLQDWQRRYYEGLKGKGKEARLVEYPAAIHAFYVFPELKGSAALVEELRGFIHRCRRRGHPAAVP
uniref:Putative carboxylesterase 18 n=1 Tax=Anthurium amnicola TaxID=1678845 RepID=A0A1D1XN57_9ARAE